MNSNKFFQKLPKNEIIIDNQNKSNEVFIELENKKRKKKLFLICKLILLFFLLILSFLQFIPKLKTNSNIQNNYNLNPKNYFLYSQYQEEFKNKDSFCDKIDPIYLLKQRIDKGPISVCSGGQSKHICYQNINNHNNDIYEHKNGVICTMENIILDPSYSRMSGISFADGPIDFSHRGFPLLQKGFFNAQCKFDDKMQLNYNKIYNTYFDAWNYDYDINKENLEELAPGKTVFFISRNQDSPNLFHGNSEIINVLAMIYLFNLDPNDIQVVFLESIEIPYYSKENEDNKDIPRDPFYDIYKKMISKGGEPIYIRNLKNKYKISKAIHVPINWDSPLYIDVDFPKCDSTTLSYKLYNDFVDKYLDIKPFEDKFITDNENYYYPESVIKAHETNTKFIKVITIQWRKVWPEKRRGQNRILNNAQQLADKLASVLPKNFLIRLINNAVLTMEEQISLIKSTDYLVGIHGAGLSLSIFLSHKSILNECQPTVNTKKRSVLCLMSALSGHITYADEVKNTANYINRNQMINFDENEFADYVLQHMKENHFF